MAGVEWDELLPDELCAKWKAWIDELKNLSFFQVPRCLRLPNPNNTKLHVFSDACKGAYSTVAYLLCKYEDRDPTYRFQESRLANYGSNDTTPRVDGCCTLR